MKCTVIFTLNDGSASGAKINGIEINGSRIILFLSPFWSSLLISHAANAFESIKEIFEVECWSCSLGVVPAKEDSLRVNSLPIIV